MKNLRPFVVLALVAVAVFALSALAGETTEKTHFKIITTDAGKVDFELDELAVGETKSFTSDQGKNVEVTRTDEGYSLDVDGKKMEIKIASGAGSAFRFETDGEGHDSREVIVMKKGGAADESDRHVMIVTDGEDEDGKKVIRKRIVTRVGGEDGEKVEVRVLGDDDAEVIDLEGLELEALGEGADGEPHVIVIKKGGDEDGKHRQIQVHVKKKVEKDDDEQN